jgi:acyl-CoA thioester hydrolase
MARTRKLHEPASVVAERRIEWSDTDASGVYHNTAAFRLFEVAESLLLSRLGFLDDVYHRLPRVRIEAEFLAPLRFRDLVEVTLGVTDVGRTSVRYAIEIRANGGLAVRATVVVVLLSEPGGRPAEWPGAYRDLLLGGGPQEPERLVDGR